MKVVKITSKKPQYPRVVLQLKSLLDSSEVSAIDVI
jgi:hypothetical protein